VIGANLPTEAPRDCAVPKPERTHAEQSGARASGCDHGTKRALVPADSSYDNPHMWLIRNCAVDDLNCHYKVSAAAIASNSGKISR
jgi:hypothetical protein